MNPRRACWAATNANNCETKTAKTFLRASGVSRARASTSLPKNQLTQNRLQKRRLPLHESFKGCARTGQNVCLWVLYQVSCLVAAQGPALVQRLSALIPRLAQQTNVTPSRSQCQGICQGGTTDFKVTDANRNQWWGLGGTGCSLQTGDSYSQNPQYGFHNQPNGPGATPVQNCCSNAFSLCEYKGDKSSTNYANVLQVTRKACGAIGVKPQDLCTFQRDAANCGNLSLLPQA